MMLPDLVYMVEHLMINTMEKTYTINKTTPTFISYPDYKINLGVKAEVYKQEGDLAYKYAPFKNMRYVNNEKGKLGELESSDFNFKLTNPVDIQAQPSYDGTVNLILTDDLNPPRIVNSRFSVIEDKRFKIIDRKGDNDTNIYDQDKIDLQTRLFKNTSTIPIIDFMGLQEGGNLQTGNYVIYFKYTDADGNESDIIAESGIISVHEGGVNDPGSISGGILNRNCNKIIKLKLLNLDTSYDYLNVYYTRSTGEDSYSKNTEFVKILDRKIIDQKDLIITLTGFENTETIDSSLLNVVYNVVTRVKSQAQVQNMLFFGNVDKPTIPYKDLEDLSLRIYPGIDNPNNIGYLNDDYNPVDGNIENIEYFNAKNIYKYTGYWNNEIYRFGIVYILKDDSLSPVFNIRGCNNLTKTSNFANLNLYILDENGNIKTDRKGNKLRNYITLSEDGYLKEGVASLENIKGVVRINDEVEYKKVINDEIGLYPLAMTFTFQDGVIDEIKKVAKGFFFVRQKRIPTILAQGLTIGVDKESYLPCFKNEQGFIMESFMDANRILTNNFERHIIDPKKYGTRSSFNGIISPELTLNKGLTAGIFNNSEFTLSNGFLDNNKDYLTNSSRHFKITSYDNKRPLSKMYLKNKMVYVEDGSPLKSAGDLYFSALAGMAEEAWRTKYFGIKDTETKAINHVRGLFSSYFGCNRTLEGHKIVNIHVPGYDQTLINEYFNIRFNSFYPFYSISDRYDINLIDEDELYRPNISNNGTRFVEYRGDCFINTVTTRLNRNFTDPETPINDVIIKSDTWKSKYLGPTDDDEDKGNTDINRSDVNAVQLGQWVTFKVFSTYNLAMRSLDDSNVDEMALTGQARGFYPLRGMSARSENKMAESEVFNIGYGSTTGEKQYNEMPDVPYIKNIFDTRIMFSHKHVNDAFKNGYRVFQGLQFKDITRQYGAVVKILDYQGSVLVIFENGIAMLPINERALIQTESGQSVHMYGAGVLPEKETPISVDFGSRWTESILVTQYGVYGVDTEAKKIWRFSQQKGFETLSDFKIQNFLNENLILDSDEHYPIIGLRNMKTHYDNFKGDVIFTFYDCTRNKDVSWNLIYNERLDKWITRTSWTPLCSENINNIFVSFNKDIATELALNAYTLTDCDESEGITIDSNIQNESGFFGELSLKGYDYYESYNKTYTVLNLDNTVDNRFYVDNNILKCNVMIQEPLIVKVKADLINNNNEEAPDFYDYLYLRPFNTEVVLPNYLYKHGQANLFDGDAEQPIPTKWYDQIHPFEFEFIVNDKFYMQKMFNNLKIISNKVQPDELEITVIGDSYEFKTSDMDEVVFTQKLKDITDRKYGRLRGNCQYKEDIWEVQLNPDNKYGKRDTRIRDKYAKIKVKYSGKDKVIITLIQTLYTISYA